MRGIFVLVALGLAGCGPETTAQPAPRANDQVGHVQANSFVRHLPGLDVDAEFITRFARGEAPQKFVRIEGGEPISLGVVRALERTARQERFGAVEPNFGLTLEGVPEDETVPIAVAVDLPNDMPREELQAHLDGYRAELSAMGVRDAVASSRMPMVYGVSRVAEVRDLARVPWITAILPNRAGSGSSDGVPNPISFLHIDTDANDPPNNLFGAGQRVGFLEVPSCGMYGIHERFDFTSIEYQHEPDPCGDTSECEDLCQGHTNSLELLDSLRCEDVGLGSNRCAWRHVSAVASCVSAADGGVEHGASSAKLFYANEGIIPPGESRPWVSCYPQAVDAAYAWLAENDVRIVNESIRCWEPTDDGWVQDWYARFEDMFLTHSAGNNIEYEACPFTLNSLCVGGTESNGEPWADGAPLGSSYLNPSGDREEPDISALAAEVEILAMPTPPPVGTTPTSEETRSGTSYSAPAIAGMAALISEACVGEASLDPRYLRAIFRNGAWWLNPAGEDYNTPRPGIDHLDGAGVPRFNYVAAFCGEDPEGGPHNASGFGPFDFPNSGPIPEGFPEESDDPPPGDDQEPTLLGLPSGGTRHGQVYFALQNMPEGGRIRTTVTWDSCPMTSHGTAPTEVSTDFDVALYHTEHGYLYASQSFDDSVEGFDVRVPEGWEGDYLLYITHEPDGYGCDADGGGENWAWAVTWWD